MATSESPGSARDAIEFTLIPADASTYGAAPPKAAGLTGGTAPASFQLAEIHNTGATAGHTAAADGFRLVEVPASGVAPGYPPAEKFESGDWVFKDPATFITATFDAYKMTVEDVWHQVQHDPSALMPMKELSNEFSKLIDGKEETKAFRNEQGEVDWATVGGAALDTGLSLLSVIPVANAGAVVARVLLVPALKSAIRMGLKQTAKTVAKQVKEAPRRIVNEVKTTGTRKITSFMDDPVREGRSLVGGVVKHDLVKPILTWKQFGLQSSSHFAGYGFGALNRAIAGKPFNHFENIKQSWASAGYAAGSAFATTVWKGMGKTLVSRATAMANNPSSTLSAEGKEGLRKLVSGLVADRSGKTRLLSREGVRKEVGNLFRLPLPASGLTQAEREFIKPGIGPLVQTAVPHGKRDWGKFREDFKTELVPQAAVAMGLTQFFNPTAEAWEKGVSAVAGQAVNFGRAAQFGKTIEHNLEAFVKSFYGKGHLSALRTGFWDNTNKVLGRAPTALPADPVKRFKAAAIPFSEGALAMSLAVFNYKSMRDLQKTLIHHTAEPVANGKAVDTPDCVHPSAEHNALPRHVTGGTPGVGCGHEGHGFPAGVIEIPAPPLPPQPGDGRSGLPEVPALPELPRFGSAPVEDLLRQFERARASEADTADVGRAYEDLQAELERRARRSEISAYFDELLKDVPVVHYMDSAPNKAKSGDVWIDTGSAGRRYVYDGSRWTGADAAPEKIDPARQDREPTAAAAGEGARAADSAAGSEPAKTTAQPRPAAGTPENLDRMLRGNADLAYAARSGQGPLAAGALPEDATSPARTETYRHRALAWADSAGLSPARAAPSLRSDDRLMQASGWLGAAA